MVGEDLLLDMIMFYGCNHRLVCLLDGNIYILVLVPSTSISKIGSAVLTHNFEGKHR